MSLLLLFLGAKRQQQQYELAPGDGTNNIQMS